ncbi:MAG: hypothetical protein QM703_01325 [Gemmatales bacterium]
MKTWGSILLGVAIAGALSYAAGKFMISMIPAGQPVAKVPELFNDPADLTPREPVVLKGPHQDDFVFNCTACHSTRLTMTQPSFPAAKWAEIVKKMVTVYGAKIDPPVEADIVKYLATVKGVK